MHKPWRGVSVIAGLFLLSTLALSACTGAPANTESSSASAARSGESLPNAPRDESEWKGHEESLKRLAETYGVTNPPRVEVIAWVKSEERGQFVEPCIVKKGFAQDADGAFIDILEEQESAFYRARYECEATYPVSPKYSAELDDENILVAYNWTIDEVIPCLEARGYEINNVPSEEVFVATYTTEPFYPFAQLATEGLTNQEWDTLERECPQIPPSDLLYGE